MNLRTTLPLTAVALLVGVLGAAQPAHSQSGAARAPAFSAQDQLTMARTLCGAAERGTAIDSIAMTSETVSGFLTGDGNTLYRELLSVDYAEGRLFKHLIVFGGHYVEGGEMDSRQGAITTVCAGVLEARAGEWTLVTRDAELAQTGFNGRDPSVSLRRLGERRHALELTQNLWNRGSSMTTVTLYEPAGASFKEVFSTATAADDCGEKEPCFTFDGSLVTDPKSDPAGYALRLLLKGTHRNGAGKIVRIPAESLSFRPQGGAYVLTNDTAAARALWEALQSPW